MKLFHIFYFKLLINKVYKIYLSEIKWSDTAGNKILIEKKYDF